MGQCEAVRGLDRSARLAALDPHWLCAGAAVLPPVPFPGEWDLPSRVVDLRDGRTVLDLGDALIGPAAFGPPGDDGLPDLAAIGDWTTTGEVSVYDLDTGGVRGAYEAAGDFILNFALSNDGRRLAMGTSGGDLIVVDVDALGRVEDPADAVDWTVTAHNGGIQTLAISDSGWIATGSASGEARVWSATGEQVADLPIQPDDPPYVIFALGTDTLYYEDGGGVIRRFAIDPDEAIALATSMLTRGFTPEECRRYFPDEPCPTFAP
jgi:hypothetical protein